MKADPPPNKPLKSPLKRNSRGRPVAKPRAASGERWQEHARHAARDSPSAELDPARLLQARRVQPTGQFIRRAALERAMRAAAPS